MLYKFGNNNNNNNNSETCFTCPKRCITSKTGTIYTTWNN